MHPTMHINKKVVAWNMTPFALPTSGLVTGWPTLWYRVYGYDSESDSHPGSAANQCVSEPDSSLV